MSARRLVLASALGSVVLATNPALADDAPSDTPILVAPPPTIVSDTSDPVCNASFVHCDQVTVGAAPIDVTEQTKSVGRALRELRRCLDRNGYQAVPATIRIKVETSSATVEVARSLEANPCILQAKTTLAAMTSETPITLACTYDCVGGRIGAPPPPPPPVAPPPPEQPQRPITTMPPPESTTPSSGSRWYGWQTLIADAASASVLAIGLGSWTVESTVIGYAGFLLAAPIVHATHGNVGRALGSFGLRLLLPALVGGIGAAVAASSNGSNTTVKDVVVASGIGMGIAGGACIVIDMSLFAWKSGEQTSGKNSGFWGAF